jgi:hypothetical protein
MPLTGMRRAGAGSAHRLGLMHVRRDSTTPGVITSHSPCPRNSRVRAPQPSTPPPLHRTAAMWHLSTGLKEDRAGSRACFALAQGLPVPWSHQPLLCPRAIVLGVFPACGLGLVERPSNLRDCFGVGVKPQRWCLCWCQASVFVLVSSLRVCVGVKPPCLCWCQASVFVLVSSLRVCVGVKARPLAQSLSVYTCTLAHLRGAV